jgi:MFS family permease
MARFFHRNIPLLAAFNFLNDFRLYAPIAILYFAEVSGSFALGMSVFSITMLSQAVLEIPTGIFSDLIGRKKTIIIGAIISVLSIACYAAGNSYSWLAIGALLEGLCRSFFSGNNNALLMDTLKSVGRQSAYAHYQGKVDSLFQVALAIASIIGGLIATFSMQLTFLLTIIPQCVSVIVSVFFVEPTIHSPNQANIYSHLAESVRLFVRNTKLRTISLASALGYAAGESGYQFRSAFISLFWPMWAIGFVTTLANIGAAASYYFSGRIIGRFKELPILVASGVYNRIVTILALIFPSWFSPLLMSSSSLLFGVESTAEESLMQQEYSDSKRATMGSINSLLGNALFAVVSILLGSIADQIGPTRALLILQIPLMLSLGLMWQVFRNNKDIARKPVAGLIS